MKLAIEIQSDGTVFELDGELLAQTITGGILPVGESVRVIFKPRNGVTYYEEITITPANAEVA